MYSQSQDIFLLKKYFHAVTKQSIKGRHAAAVMVETLDITAGQGDQNIVSYGLSTDEIPSYTHQQPSGQLMNDYKLQRNQIKPKVTKD